MDVQTKLSIQNLIKNDRFRIQKSKKTQKIVFFSKNAQKLVFNKASNEHVCIPNDFVTLPLFGEG